MVNALRAYTAPSPRSTIAGKLSLRLVQEFGRRPADLSFLLSSAKVPTLWTQHPEGYPVLTGWFAGPRTESVTGLAEHGLVELGLASLADIFGISLDRLRKDLVASRAINWGDDPFARGAYSYATP